MRTLWPRALALTVSASFVACSSSKSHDVTVNWSDTKQTMDGFGASSAFFGQSLTNDQADQLFDPKKGIGFFLAAAHYDWRAGRHDDRQNRA